MNASGIPDRGVRPLFAIGYCGLTPVTSLRDHFFITTALTFSAIFPPKISIDFMSMACEGPPTSMCAEKRVSPNSSCMCRILSTTSLASPKDRHLFYRGRAHTAGM